MICPNGWHLPSKFEYETLINTVCHNKIEESQKTSYMFYTLFNDGKSKLNLLAGGYSNNLRVTSFVYLDYNGNYWCSDENSHLCIDSHIEYVNFSKNWDNVGFSVRCVKNK